MDLFLFRCSGNKLLTAITNLQDGSNIPSNACNGQWQFWKNISVNLGDPPRIAAPSAQEILNAINTDGYMINQAEINFTETVVRE